MHTVQLIIQFPAVMVNKAVPHKLISSQTNLQAVAVRTTLFKIITVCSVYLPPSQKWDIKDLEDLYVQLPSPVLLLGDFNAHSQTWGCRDTNRPGKCIEDFILKQNVCKYWIFNILSPRYWKYVCH